jgi:hypothetical protein
MNSGTGQTRDLAERRAPAERREHRPKLDTGQAAEHCGLGHSTLVKYRVFGGGPPFFKLGRRVVYDVDDLDIWLEARRRISTSDNGACE